ncbi:hypothetical protein HKD37_06G016034 [Glycine soja]
MLQIKQSSAIVVGRKSAYAFSIRKTFHRLRVGRYMIMLMLLALWSSIEDRSYASAGEVVLEKLPEDGEGKSDLADVEEAVDEDGEGDVARGGVRLLLGAEENRGGEALHLREGGEDSIERKGSAS